MSASNCPTEWRQADDRLAALSADIGSEVRTARDQLVAARQASAFHEKVLLPQRRTALRESLLHYNAMQISVYELLAAKELQQVTERQAIESLRDYWLARTDLERALGRRLPADATARPAAAEPAPAENPHHAHK
jgi:cobalt-zinc-cadmium efflux system outer membrane protein